MRFSLHGKGPNKGSLMPRGLGSWGPRRGSFRLDKGLSSFIRSWMHLLCAAPQFAVAMAQGHPLVMRRGRRRGGEG